VASALRRRELSHNPNPALVGETVSPAEVRRTGRDYSHDSTPRARGPHPLVTVLALSVAWAGFGWVVWTCTVGTLFS